MDGTSPEVPTGVDAQAVSQAEAPVPAPIATPKENSTSGLGKLLARFGLGKREPKPLIEVKPPVAPDSEGRARIDREQLRQNLEEPSRS